MPNGIGKKIKQFGISKSSAYKKCLSQGGKFVKGKCELPKGEIRTGRSRYAAKQRPLSPKGIAERRMAQKMGLGE